jgi:predicted Ser/Thr protein kinase
MARCPSCSADVPERSRFCLACGAALASASEALTWATTPPNTPLSSTSIDEGRFPPGTVLAERYRIVGLLGQGGMGEVYRANDLVLGQPVALKFLPPKTDPQSLERFRAEVRIARQVSHPNVCRVYDIGQVDGSAFLSMEYVDGEDLRSLLRRIGRLPGDKAVEIARKLCAGLAAAHDKGVLHRDLKPANIMIDGRGHVLITDFGIAAFAGQIKGGQVREGTPDYMAPEQMAGKEVSARSDIYALGLVLHEMFTGKRAFENGLERFTPTTVNSTVKDVDPLVERVILRCLDVDPRNRPPSALSVAAALPGGDPLAAALAAGDTPTPGMVAASGDTQGISVRAACIWLALILVGLGAALVVGARTSVFAKTPFENSPDVLTRKARDLIQSFGYSAPPADRAWGFVLDTDYQNYAERQAKPVACRNQLARGQPPLVLFWFRQSPQPLAPLNFANGIVSRADPPPINSGMVGLDLDPEGRLIRFDAVPPQVEAQPDSPRPPDWTALFTAAGLDMTRFASAEPQWLPLAGFDARAAWTGSYAGVPDLQLRVEAASWHGKLVFFRVIGPSSRPERMQPAQLQAGDLVFFSLAFALLGLAAFTAWRNFRSGRGDVQGASRLAAFAFGVESLEWLCTAHQVGLLSVEGMIMWAAFTAGFLWTLYMALEPYVRRRWPQSMISWSRLLGGGFRDPLVGGHMLAGVAMGIGAVLCVLFANRYRPLNITSTLSLNLVLGSRSMTGEMLGLLITGIGEGLFLVFLFFLLRVMLRRQWLAAAVVILPFTVLGALSGAPVTVILFDSLSLLFSIAGMIWFGVLSAVVTNFVLILLQYYLLTTDFSVWYAGPTVAAVAVVLALTAYAFHTAVAGRPLFKAGFLEMN